MKPTRVIVHCSDTPDSGDRFGAEDIDKWHRERGFSQLGYHRVIRRTGIIELGRRDNVQGAHAQGHNQDSLGVCYIGRKIPTLEQVRSLLWLYQDWNNKFQIHWASWFGHYEVKNTECPGFPMPCLRMLLANFENREFELDDSTQIKTFLEVALRGETRK